MTPTASRPVVGRLVRRACGLAALLPVVLAAQAAGPAGAVRLRITSEEATAVFQAVPDHVPPGLAGRQGVELETAWRGWLARQDAEIRDRLTRGDEDSLVNLWLYGTSFTRQPPAREPDVAARGSAGGLAAVVERRLEDFLDALAAPGTRERLQFAREFFVRTGLDPATEQGRRRVRERLIAIRERVVAEFRDSDRVLETARRDGDPAAEIAAYATIFSGRGLSSDTSVAVQFGVDQTLKSLRGEEILPAGSVRRAAVVGPGLDLLPNKADGYDFYPPQTIQPFALADSLLRHGISTAGDLRITTFDLSAAVNRHLEDAIRMAAEGRSYLFHAPLDGSETWRPDLLRYWEQLGDRIGDAVPVEAPPDAGNVRLRAIRVGPAIVEQIEPFDLNVVVERLELTDPADRFDLIVATNVFVYYDPFQQTLAAVNLARMLRPGGVLVTNTLIQPAAPLLPTTFHAVIPYSERQYDHLFWYRRE